MAITPAHAEDEVNIYSARHYDSDSLLFDGFRKATGIPVNVIIGKGPELLVRLKAEGASTSAATSSAVRRANGWAGRAISVVMSPC